MVGLGQATDFFTEFPGCQPFGVCIVRTVVLTDGSRLVLDETPTSFSVPGNSWYLQPNSAFGHPLRVTFTDTVDGWNSTGIFAGASGTLTGEAQDDGGMQISTLSGSITLT